jgi:peptidoglycan/xylan/chitin deacetylase (PgdA/CDA1 family)
LSYTYPEAIFHVKTNKKLVALTIDDSPDSVTTLKILEILSKYDSKATFFLITNYISGNEKIVTRIANEGHEIGNHMTSDEPSYQLSNTEFSKKFNKADSILSEYSEIRWFRPGSGIYTNSMINTLNNHEKEYLFVLGSVYPLDPVIPSSSFASFFITQNIRPGSIIILHDRGDRGKRTVKTLKNILPKLNSKGYKLVTLSELYESQRSL